jgi:hypothetical protein
MLFGSKSVHDDPRNFERGLLFVPLLIHLPPISDDIVGNGRDARDVMEENISRAQTIYSIIAGTFDDKKRSRKDAQPHFAFEIVGTGGVVKIYASVPVEIVELVKQAVISAYPATRFEEVKDYNIFNETGGVNAIAGGELELKENYAFPIATYVDLKRDTMQALLSSLAILQKEDGVAVQILLRPAKDSWHKSANEIAAKKRKGKYDKKSGYNVVGDTLKQMAVALVKAPEEHKKDKEEEPISGLDQSIVEAIENKTRYPGFETIIRIVVSSNVSQRSEAILNNVVASFSLYNSPGKNGFKFKRSADVQELATELLLRAFPAQQNKMILNVVEAATIFHFPDQSNVPTSQLSRQESKQVDGPRNVPEEGLLLGYNVFRGAKKPIRLALQDRQRHMYVVGQTGTGKSTYLENLALQDMLNGNGFAFVDPHGDTAEKLLAMVPRERAEDVIYFSPADMDYPMGLNLFEYENPDQKDFLIQETLNMLQKLYDPTHQGIMGPRYEHIFRNAALLIMADPSGGTFVDIPKLFRDPGYLKQKLTYVKDNTVREFWEKEYPASQRSNDAGEVTSWFVSKFGAFLSNEMMRNIIGQTKSALNLREIMDNKKILLVNLSKGRTGDLNSKLLGMIFVMRFQAAAMSRANVPEDQRVDFSLYVDEFQNFSTDSFATIMSEARKYRLNLIVANQFTTQLTEEIRDAVFGNMGTIVAFRIGQNDVEALSRYFQPTFDGDDLLRVPNYNSIVRTLIGGVPTQPFSMATLPPLGKPNPRLAAALKQLSAVKYGRPKKEVEAEIFERMKTLPVPTTTGGPRNASATPWPGNPAAGQRPEIGGLGPSGAAAVTAPAAAPSFLDGWLNKKKTSRPATPAAPSAKKVTTIPKSTSSPAAHSNTSPVSPPKASLRPSPAAKLPKPTDDMPGMDLRPKNFSSEASEREEVDKIAKELRHDLGEHHAEKVIQPPHNEEQVLHLPKPKGSTGVASTAAKPTATLHKSETDPDDTIAIDQEGNLIVRKRNDSAT